MGSPSFNGPSFVLCLSLGRSHAPSFFVQQALLLRSTGPPSFSSLSRLFAWALHRSTGPPSFSTFLWVVLMGLPSFNGPSFVLYVSLGRSQGPSFVLYVALVLIGLVTCRCTSCGGRVGRRCMVLCAVLLGDELGLLGLKVDGGALDGVLDRRRQRDDARRHRREQSCRREDERVRTRARTRAG